MLFSVGHREMHYLLSGSADGVIIAWEIHPSKRLVCEFYLFFSFSGECTFIVCKIVMLILIRFFIFAVETCIAISRNT